MGCAASDTTAKSSGDIWKDLKTRLPYDRTNEDLKRRVELFAKFDVKKNKSLTVEECLAGCTKHLELQNLTKDLPTINAHAYQAACGLRTKADGTSGVDPAEFRLYLVYLREYFELFIMFDAIDNSNDKVVTLDEFKKAVPKLTKWGATIDDPEAEFQKVDKDGSGVSFDEFANWAITQRLDGEKDADLKDGDGKNDGPADDAAPAVPAAPAEEKSRDIPAASGETSAQKRRRLLADISKRLPRTKTPEENERRDEVFKSFDPNGNGYLSYAEIEAGCINILKLDEFEKNLQPILIRAYDKARGARVGKGENAEVQDSYVERVEFRLLLAYVFDYFELWVMFDEVDSSDDCKISPEEFKKSLPLLEKWGVKVADADETFKAIDKNGGGVVLFQEFAEWAVVQHLDCDGQENIQ